MNEQSSIQQGANISSTPETDTGTQGITDGNATSKTLPESTEVAATEHRQPKICVTPNSGVSFYRCSLLYSVSHCSRFRSLF